MKNFRMNQHLDQPKHFVPPHSNAQYYDPSESTVYDSKYSDSKYASTENFYYESDIQDCSVVEDRSSYVEECCDFIASCYSSDEMMDGRLMDGRLMDDQLMDVDYISVSKGWEYSQNTVGSLDAQDLPDYISHTYSTDTTY